MKAWQVACIMGAIAGTGIYLAAGNTPAAIVPDPMPEAAITLAAPALSAAVPEAPARAEKALAEPALVTAAASGPLMASAEIAAYSIGPKLASLGHRDVAQLVPATRDASDDASNSGRR